MLNDDLRELTDEVKKYKSSVDDTKEAKRFSTIFFPFLKSLVLETSQSFIASFNSFIGLFKTHSTELKNKISEVVTGLEDIQKKIPQIDYSSQLKELLKSIESLTPKEAEKKLSDVLLLIQKILDKPTLPESILEKDRVKIILSDEQLKELKKATSRGSAYPFVGVVDQETKTILNEIKQNTADTETTLALIKGVLDTILSEQDPLSKYQISDNDSDTYFGYQAANADWYIMKTTGSTFRYYKGNNYYAENWDDRATLAYDYFYVIF